MKPKSFTYLRPASIDEAVQALARWREDARILAGGQSLVAMMNFRLIEAQVLIDVSDLAPLAYIRESNGEIEVGASTTQAQFMTWPKLAERAPLLNAAMPHVGHYQTRSRGTVCGSIAHSDPSSELPLCLATLGGSVVMTSSRGTRVLSCGDFQTGMLTTARLPDELITAVRFPTRKPGAGYAFTEMAQRHGDFAICAVAAMVSGKTTRLGVRGGAEKATAREWSVADWPASDAERAYLPMYRLCRHGRRHPGDRSEESVGRDAVRNESIVIRADLDFSYTP